MADHNGLELLSEGVRVRGSHGKGVGVQALQPGSAGGQAVYLHQLAARLQVCGQQAQTMAILEGEPF